MTTISDKRKLKKIVKDLFDRANETAKDGEINREDVAKMAKNDLQLKRLIESSIQNVRNVGKLIEQDLED